MASLDNNNETKRSSSTTPTVQQQQQFIDKIQSVGGHNERLFGWEI